MLPEQISNLFGNSLFHMMYEKIDDILSLILSWEYFNQFFLIFISCFLIYTLVRSAFALRQRHFSFLKSLLSKTKINELPLYFIFRNSSNNNMSLYDEFIKGKKKISKYTLNLFFSKHLEYSKTETNDKILYYMSELGLDQTHEDMEFLEYSLKKLFSVIAYFSYDDLQLKQNLFDYGWNFADVNEIFQNTYLELREIINQSFLVYPNNNIYTIIKKIKIISAQGYTLKQIYSVLNEFGYSNSLIKKIDNIILKTQKVSNYLFNEHNLRIYENLCKNTLNIPYFNSEALYQNF